MKNYLLFLILTCICLNSCQDEKVSSDMEVKEAIKAVVEGETYAYMEKDYQKWASYWDHSDEVLRLDVSQAGFAQIRGWEKSGGNLESFFKENPEPIKSTFKNSNYLIFHDAKLAWVAFDQSWTTESGEASVAKATITLVKKENEWKIISYTAIQYEEEAEGVDTLERD